MGSVPRRWRSAESMCCIGCGRRFVRRRIRPSTWRLSARTGWNCRCWSTRASPNVTRSLRTGTTRLCCKGARDVQQAFAKKKIDYALHLERRGHHGPHLKTLGQRAAVVVTEEMPTEPLRSWTVRLSQMLPGSLLVVDTACVVPMQLVGKSYERAFAFRNATKSLYAERISLAPTDHALRVTSPAPMDLPFERIDLSDADLAGLVSECEIDHSIGPVPHTVGGSVAGYRRWHDFKQESLSNYDRRRNNPLIDGVSRMSPYLHYGMVAPTRIAREAAAGTLARQREVSR